MPQSDFLSRLFKAAGWSSDHKLNEREDRIIAHYIRETERGHMTDNTAIERAVGDIKGWNWHPTRCYSTTTAHNMGD